MINFMNLCKTILTFCAYFNNFQTYFIRIINHKNKIEILARFRPIFNFELNGKGQEPSRAENPSAQAMAQASSARTHHYTI